MSSDEENPPSLPQLFLSSESGGSGDTVEAQLDGSAVQPVRSTAGDQHTSRVIHYKVDLPPCFHGDGKDKESFSLWKARLELAVRACPASQQQDLATILPTRLSGDALAFWLSLPPATQKDYDACVSRLTDVFGGKQFLQHFQTFVNARQRLPKEPLEVFAAEINRLVFEAFPGYGQPAIAMERFRRFVAGLDPVLQVKCHEHGATTLEQALDVACKCERAQEALRLAQPQCVGVSPPAASSPASSQPAAHLTAMVSSGPVSSVGVNSDILSAISQLSAEVRTLKLAVTDLSHQKSSPTSPGVVRPSQRSPERSSHRQSGAAFSLHERDQHEHHRHRSPDPRGRRYTNSPPSSPFSGHRRSSGSWDTYHQQQGADFRRQGSSSPRRLYSQHDDYPHRRYGSPSPHRLSGSRDDYHLQQSPAYSRHSSSSPPRPAWLGSSGSRGSSHRRSYSPAGSGGREPSYNRRESSWYSRGPSQRREHSPAGATARREPFHDRHHVSFTMEGHELQGNEW